VLPNRDLTERVATLPYLDLDHYESTHDECDTLSARVRFQRIGLPKSEPRVLSAFVEKVHGYLPHNARFNMRF
jgi:hypothetical protein